MTRSFFAALIIVLDSRSINLFNPLGCFASNGFWTASCRYQQLTLSFNCKGEACCHRKLGKDHFCLPLKTVHLQDVTVKVGKSVV